MKKKSSIGDYRGPTRPSPSSYDAEIVLVVVDSGGNEGSYWDVVRYGYELKEVPEVWENTSRESTFDPGS